MNFLSLCDACVVTYASYPQVFVSGLGVVGNFFLKSVSVCEFEDEGARGGCGFGFFGAVRGAVV